MPRISLPVLLPVLLLLATIALFGQKYGLWGQPEPGPPSSVTADAPPQPPQGSIEPPAANAVAPPAEMNPASPGTPAPPPPPAGQGQVPASATPIAPSGEPAAPVERR